MEKPFGFVYGRKLTFTREKPSKSYHTIPYTTLPQGNERGTEETIWKEPSGSSSVQLCEWLQLLSE